LTAQRAFRCTCPPGGQPDARRRGNQPDDALSVRWPARPVVMCARVTAERSRLPGSCRSMIGGGTGATSRTARPSTRTGRQSAIRP